MTYDWIWITYARTEPAPSGWNEPDTEVTISHHFRHHAIYISPFLYFHKRTLCSGFCQHLFRWFNKNADRKWLPQLRDIYRHYVFWKKYHAGSHLCISTKTYINTSRYIIHGGQITKYIIQRSWSPVRRILCSCSLPHNGPVIVDRGHSMLTS